MNMNRVVSSTALPFMATCLLITNLDRSSIVAAQDREQARPADGGIVPGTPMPLELAFSYRRLSHNEMPAINPTGTHLAYSVWTPAKIPNDLWTLPSGLLVDLIGTRLNVTDISTGRPIEIGPSDSTTFSPSWAPDGKRLAYYSDEGGFIRAWILDLPTGKATPAADLRIKVQPAESQRGAAGRFAAAHCVKLERRGRDSTMASH